MADTGGIEKVAMIFDASPEARYMSLAQTAVQDAGWKGHQAYTIGSAAREDLDENFNALIAAPDVRGKRDETNSELLVLAADLHIPRAVISSQLTMPLNNQDLLLSPGRALARIQGKLGYWLIRQSQYE